MQRLEQDQVDDIRAMVLDYFSEECDIEKSELHEDTNIIKDLEGDSLMFLSLLEIVRKKYGLTIELKTLGRHLMKKPANTIGQVIDLTTKIVQYGDGILSMDL